MREQYHFWPGEQGHDAWDVDRLIHLSRDLPAFDIGLDGSPRSTPRAGFRPAGR